MGNRFFITGVQIGMIKAFAKLENEEDINKLLDEIEEKQFIGDAEEFNKLLKKQKTKTNNHSEYNKHNY